MRFVVMLLALVLTATNAHAQCGVERWPVKTATDADAVAISTVVMPTTIAHLHGLPAPRPLPQERRIEPVETTNYSVAATLVEYRLAEDSSYQLVLADEAGRTMLAQIPSMPCSGGSRLAIEINAARLTFESRFPPSSTFRTVRVPVEVRGIGFFDFVRGQRGMASNGISLYPATSLNFNLFNPPRAPYDGRRRVVGHPGEARCKAPSLTLTASKTNACSGESVVLTWQASDPQATVAIYGIGALLPSSGSTTVGSTGSTVYSGRATTSCGSGAEAVAMVTIQRSASASLNGPASVQRGSTASLSWMTSGTTTWTLTSSLRNSVTPSSGNGAGSFSGTYTATNSGTDNVTLTGTGGPCGSVSRQITIVVNAPSGGGNLLCCDGTRSPSCTSCSDQRGCCSSHRGVCSCG
jgi:hypothetical protein